MNTLHIASRLMCGFARFQHPLHLTTLSSRQKNRFREKYDVFFFDKDGTLITLKNKALPGVSKAITTLASLGKQLHVVTDSCISARADLAKSIQAEFPEFEMENVISASWLLTKHLKDIGFNKKIYAIGDPNGILKELKEAGFQVESDGVFEIDMTNLLNLNLDQDVGAVVLGGDMNFSYLKLVKALNYLKDPNILFFITHLSIVGYYSPILPATGALSIPIEIISKRKPISCSKSTPASIEYIYSLGCDMSRCLFVGDGLENDVACGNLCGMDTLLVLSGTSTLEDVERARQRGDHHLIPTYVGGSVADLSGIFSKDCPR